eukprot:3934635-Prymnesium_polylepis.1
MVQLTGGVATVMPLNETETMVFFLGTLMGAIIFAAIQGVRSRRQSESPASCICSNTGAHPLSSGAIESHFGLCLPPRSCVACSPTAIPTRSRGSKTWTR